MPSEAVPGRVQAELCSSPRSGEALSPLDSLLRQCVHCGMCISACPTYTLFGTEMDNPRGRLALLRAATGSRVPVDGVYEEHIERCLGCMACFPSCPSGVAFPDLLAHARALASQDRTEGVVERTLYYLALRQLFPHRERLRFFALLLTLYQASGLQWLVRRFSLLPSSLQTAEALLPPWPFTLPTRGSVRSEPPGTRGRIGLFVGCIQEAFLGRVNQATVRVLEHNGYEVVIPRNQTCCGGLHTHRGERELAAELAKQNIAAFIEADVEAIVVNAGGCGAALEEYPELLNGSDRQQAEEFRDCLRDVSEFLMERGVALPEGRLPIRATYADSCHLRNIQGIVQPPRDLIRSIPCLEYRELDHPDQCCGSAGIYNILQPDISRQLLEAKVTDIAATGADVVVVANPGCHMQIASGIRQAGLDIRVLHLVELLDEAYAAEGTKR